jgi:hypothetical protein
LPSKEKKIKKNLIEIQRDMTMTFKSYLGKETMALIKPEGVFTLWLPPIRKAP